ncbi:hypothetical protein D3C81_1360390 [compost metagenome]
MVDAVRERFRAEQHRQRHGHGAQLVDRHAGNDGFDALGHDDGHAVAPAHAQLAQRAGESVGLGLDMGVGVGVAAPVLVLGVDRHAVHGGRISGPAAAADVGQVEVLGHVPVERVM